MAHRLRTLLREQLGIEYPIIQAGMAIHRPDATGESATSSAREVRRPVARARSGARAIAYGHLAADTIGRETPKGAPAARSGAQRGQDQPGPDLRPARGAAMDFELSEEHRMLRDMVRTFVDKELIPLENAFGPRREIPPEVMAGLQAKTREMGLWMLDVPEEYGGAGLDLLSRCIIDEQVGRTSLFHWHSHQLFGPALRPVLLACNDEQKQRFLWPVLRGEIRICFAQTEPDAGQRPGQHAHPRGPRWRRLRHQRREALHHRAPASRSTPS